MACDALEFCCESGVQGDQKCKGRCISADYLNDNQIDCDNGVDEGSPGNYCKFKKEKKDILQMCGHIFISDV